MQQLLYELCDMPFLKLHFLHCRVCFKPNFVQCVFVCELFTVIQRLPVLQRTELLIL